VTHVPIEPFERRYQEDPDPWRFASSPYEQRRYDLTVAALLRPRYERAFEPGCAIGELTRRLAARCALVQAMDAAPTAVAAARARCRELPNVFVAEGELPRDWPAGRFDLVVLSEIGYYFTVPVLEALRERALDSLTAGGTLVAVHWRGVSPDHLLAGDDVHGCLRATARARPAGHYEDDGFLLDLWERT
jgi:SAM-dependent methyltransferase